MCRNITNSAHFKLVNYWQHMLNCPFYKTEDNIRLFPLLSEWKSFGGGVVMESNELKQEGSVILASFLFLLSLFGESGFTSDLSNVSYNRFV